VERFAPDKVNDALARLKEGAVRYRVVLDESLAQEAEKVEQGDDAEGNAEKPKNETAGHGGDSICWLTGIETRQPSPRFRPCYLSPLASLASSNSRRASPDSKPPEISMSAKGAAFAI